MGHRIHAGSHARGKHRPIAAEAGVPITIMNMGRTQYDRLADRLIHDDIAVALPQLVDETITAEQ